MIRPTGILGERVRSMRGLDGRIGRVRVRAKTRKGSKIVRPATDLVRRWGHSVGGPSNPLDVVIAVAVVLPLLGEWLHLPIWLQRATSGGRVSKVALFTLFALGLNVVVGFAGLLDLGYVAFWAIGAYTAGILTGAAEAADVEEGACRSALHELDRARPLDHQQPVGVGEGRDVDGLVEACRSPPALRRVTSSERSAPRRVRPRGRAGAVASPHSGGYRSDGPRATEGPRSHRPGEEISLRRSRLG